jgi:hypothetical protein
MAYFKRISGSEKEWNLHLMSTANIVQQAMLPPVSPQTVKLLLEFVEISSDRPGWAVFLGRCNSHQQYRTDRLVELARRWFDLKHNPAEEESMLCSLLELEPESDIIQKAKEQAHTSPPLLCILLRTSPDTKTISLAKSFVAANPHDYQTFFLLMHLVQAAPEDDTVRAATDWIDANPGHARLTELICECLCHAPNEELVVRAKSCLDTTAEDNDLVSLIVSLLRTCPDAQVITRAQDWLKSADKSYSSLTNEGRILSALFESAPNDFVAARARIWLKLAPPNEQLVSTIEKQLHVWAASQ